MARIVVFSGNLGYSVRKGIVEIDAAVPGLSWLVLLHAPRKEVGRLLRSQWRNLRRNGWRWVPYQVDDLWRRLTARGGVAIKPSTPGAAYTAEALRARLNLRLLVVGDIHADEALSAVRDFQPDLGLSLAAPILRPSLFTLPRLGTLNLHKGRAPDYRGMPPAFWELWNDESIVGCTIHRVAEKLDAGDVVREGSVARAKYSDVRGVQLTLDELGVGLTRDAVLETLAGTAPSRPQGEGGRTYRKPTLAQADALNRRLPHPGRSTAIAKRVAKSALLGLLGAGAALTGRLPLTPRITVLLYHRVTDDARDNLSVGIAQFDRQMELVRERCTPLSIEDALASAGTNAGIPGSPKPLVAVTFDDGYLDNYEHAAPILERHGIPAAFFVSTGIVNSDRRFPHDVRRENPPIPVMTWDHLRAMRDRGFTIGSHTVSHVDCGAESDAVVHGELKRSRDDLARELGDTTFYFAYPYGGRANMTPARLERVKQAGYAACLSAYGGSNVRRVEAYDIRRRGIHWEFSDGAFLLECHGVT